MTLPQPTFGHGANATRWRNMEKEIPEGFAPLGTAVEAIVYAKPGPAAGYACGVIAGYNYSESEGEWRVKVRFATPAGGFYGRPILRVSTVWRFVHVIGSDTEPFSTRTPQEIKAFFDSDPCVLILGA